MSISGSSHFNHINRLQPVEKDHNEDDNKDEKRKKRVLYQGRSWGEMEGELPVQPVIPKEEKKEKQSKKNYADHVLMNQAQHFFESLTTLEDKIAQICFYETEAFYDHEQQQGIDLLIQKGEIGGVVFTKGEYKRQSYLIEHYQSLAKIPLLIGNDFFHGLSFYFQGGNFSSLQQGQLDERHLSDLGKAVMSQNRRLGVHFQFDGGRAKTSDLSLFLNETRRRAFRRGIRNAQGVVAKEKSLKKNNEEEAFLHASPKTTLSVGNLKAQMKGIEQVQEAVAANTLTFLDLSEGEGMEERLLIAFKSSCDAILFKENISKGIEFLANAIRTGMIHEEELEKKLMRILMMKAQFFLQVRK